MRVKGENHVAKTILVLVLLVVGAGLTACGGGGTASSGSSAAAASVTTIFPNAAPAGALAFTLNVTGSNFASGSTVNWNGSSRTTTFVSSTQLQAHIMAADLALPGKATVTVVNTGAPSSSGITFTIATDTIAYQSNRALDGSDGSNGANNDNVWVINPDGSGSAPLTKLSAPGTFVIQPAWSPDGSRIAFASGGALDGSNAPNTTNSTSNIWVIKADGTGATPLTKLTAFLSDSFTPTWSPDGSKIAFLSDRALDGGDATNNSGIFNIWVVNPDGSGATPLTRITAAALTTAPVWSPDGSKIVFSSARALDGSNAANTTVNIWVMNADGTGLTALTKNTVGGNEEPVWSPDGSKIAFASHRALDGSDTLNTNQTENIWMVNADGSNVHPLTQITAASNSSLPAWSPDGSKLVFFSSRALDGSNAANTTINIWVINADGSSPAPLTKNTAGGDSLDAVWTPDGSKILYTSAAGIDGSNTDNIAKNIWLMNADGSNATPLSKITVNTTTVISDLATQP